MLGVLCVKEPSSLLPNSFAGTLGSAGMAALTQMAIHYIIQWLSQYESTHSFLTCGDRSVSEIDFALSEAVFVYLIMSISLLCYDYYNECTGQLSKKKLPMPGRKTPNTLNYTGYRRAFEQVSINIAIGTVAEYLVFLPLYQWRGICDDKNYSFSGFGLTEWVMFFIKLPMAVVMADAIFYFIGCIDTALTAHRLCHENNYLYANVHKYHHQWVEDTVAAASIACHPIEHVMVNLSTVMLPFALLGYPFVVNLVWFAAATINTNFSHCGYNMWGRFSALPHHYHHTMQTVAFGAGGFCDYLFQTRIADRYPRKWTQIVENEGLVHYKQKWIYHFRKYSHSCVD